MIGENATTIAENLVIRFKITDSVKYQNIKGIENIDRTIL